MRRSRAGRQGETPTRRREGGGGGHGKAFPLATARGHCRLRAAPGWLASGLPPSLDENLRAGGRIWEVWQPKGKIAFEMLPEERRGARWRVSKSRKEVLP